ncbi:hypothetical protein BX616_000161 [Lobosporangium transversale]|nr:hypothetical protein BX616_000161 [Lobosporangium transversale]
MAATSSNTPVITAVSPALQRPSPIQQQHRRQQQQKERHQQEQQLQPLQRQSSPYTGAKDSVHPISPSQSIDLKTSVAVAIASRPTMLNQSQVQGQELGQQKQQQQSHIPHNLKLSSPPHQSLSPQQSGQGSSILALPPKLQTSANVSPSPNLSPSLSPSPSPTQSLRSNNVMTSKTQHEQASLIRQQGRGQEEGQTLTQRHRDGNGHRSPPGNVPRRTSSPLVSPSSPLAQLPPLAFAPKSTAAPNTTIKSLADHSTTVPKPRPIPPTLPPARAHGIHARAIPRPQSNAPNPPMSSTIVPSPVTENGATLSTGKQAPLLQSSGTREPIYPAPTLQAPQQAHQPRQRQSASSVRSPLDSSAHNRPTPPPPPPPARHLSNVSVPDVQISKVSTKDKMLISGVVDVCSNTKSNLSLNQKENLLHNSLDPDLEDDEGEDEYEGEDDESEDIRKVENEKTKRSKQRKVRKSFEKLARLSIEKRRKSRQLKPLTPISSASLSPAADSTVKTETVVTLPKRQSLWASLFGNGRTESRPSLADSLVRGNISTQSLGSLGSQSKEQSGKGTGGTVSLNSPVSLRSDGSLSEVSTESNRHSELSDSAVLPEQFSSGESVNEPIAASRADTDDASQVNIVRHERSRTLPGIIPQWDASILWSLTRALNAKKSTAPPLQSDSSSDSDISAETATEGEDDFENDTRASVETDHANSQKPSSSNADNVSEQAAGNKSPTGVSDNLPSSPSIPAKAALSAWAKERVIVAEAQVQIGDDMDDDNPFTDSHALPGTPSGRSNTFHGQFSAVSSSPGSSPSSLSPLSYLTGSASTGSNWSLQGSRKSLMKMIFKSKNESSSVGGIEVSGSSSPQPNVEQSHPKAGGSSSSASPSMAKQPQIDLFSDFESSVLPDITLDVQTKGMKRRSYVIPGAFPGQERSSEDHSLGSGPEYALAHVPMYATSENELLVIPNPEEVQYGNSSDNSDYHEEREVNQFSDSDSSSEQEVISTQPVKASYERASFLQGHLPRFNTDSSPSFHRHQSLSLSQQRASSIASVVKEQEAPVDFEPLHIEVHSTATVVSGDSAQGSVHTKVQSTMKKRSNTISTIGQEKASPSILALDPTPNAVGGSLSTQKAPVSSISSPKAQPSLSIAPDTKQKTPIHIPSIRDDKEDTLDSPIDYCRYKEEMAECGTKSLQSNQRHLQRPTNTHRGSISDTESIESLPSDQTNEDSPLVVEVISSGLRTSTASERPVSPSILAASKQMRTSHIQSASTLTSQPQIKSNPPPLPPPRNARRPRSKPSGRHTSTESMHTPVDHHSISSTTGGSPFERLDNHETYLVTSTGEYPRALGPMFEGPAREQIMEEMGSDQARTFNEEDYLYCQSRQELRSGNGQISRGQSYGQPYEIEKSTFDPSPEYTRGQQGQSAMQIQSQQNLLQDAWFSQCNIALDPANDSALVATLREQIASLSNERDQFYNETLLLRQKHEMLTSLVNNMGVAVETIQQQQILQQLQQQQQQQYQSFSQPSENSDLNAMSNMMMASGDVLDESFYNNYLPSNGHNDYGFPDPQQHSQVQPRRHHDDTAVHYIEQTAQALDNAQHLQFEFAHPPSQIEHDPYPILPQQEESQFQPRRNHFHDADQSQSHHTNKSQQRSAEYLIQMPRSSEDSVLGSSQYQQDQTTDLTPSQDFGSTHNATNTADPSTYGHGSSYTNPLESQQACDSHQSQLPSLQGPPMSFGEGYDLIPTGDSDSQVLVTALTSGDHLNDHFAHQQHQQIEDEQQRAGLSLKQLKQQHQGHQYRRSIDTHYSSQSSQDGYQLLDIITTRPMPGGNINVGQDFVAPSSSSAEYAYSDRQLHESDHGTDHGYGSLNPYALHFTSARPLSNHEQIQHPVHLQQPELSHNAGSHLRRHHSMHHPQSVTRQVASLDTNQPQHQLYLQQQLHYQQQNAQATHQPRPPVWAPQHLTHSNASTSMHRRQPSNQQRDSSNLTNSSANTSAGLLLLSTPTSFMNVTDSPMISSSTLSGASGASSDPLSVLSNVVQQEKVRVGEKTSAQNGAAGWSERPFSPILSNTIETRDSATAVGNNNTDNQHMSSFTAAVMAIETTNEAQNTNATRSRVLTKEETDKIRQQFDSYLADPKRKNRQIEVDTESKVLLQEHEHEHEHEHGLVRYNERNRGYEPSADTASNSESDADHTDNYNHKDYSRKQFVTTRLMELTLTSGSSSLSRSKTIASTGVSTRGARGHSHRASGQFSLQSSGSNALFTNGNGNGDINQQATSQLAKDTLVRHNSSSGSLRSVPRHNEQRRSESLRPELGSGSHKVDNNDSNEERTALHVRTTGHVEDHRLRPGTTLDKGSSTTKLVALATQYPLPPPPALASALSHTPVQNQGGQNQNQQQLSSRKLIAPLRPSASYKVPVDSPIPLPSSSTSSMSSLNLLTSSSKTVLDEEGGDFGLQAQPRRYNSVKLGMTGVTGVTRRAIGRPVERGHGIERGPEDCV